MQTIKIIIMKKINPEKFYTPTEITKLGILTASTPDTQRQMLLRHIRENRIEATNLGGNKKPRYVVQGKNLIGYMTANMKPGESSTK